MSSVVAPPGMYAPNLMSPGVLAPPPTVFELSPIIGPPLQTITIRQGMNMPIDLHTMGMAMDGRVAHLAVFLANLFKLTENNFIFSLFPIKQLGDHHWMTTTYTFDSNISIENPSQVAPSIGSYKKNVQSGTLTRFNWGVQMLIETLMTPEGVMIYEGLTVQCLQAFVRAFEAMALTAIMNIRAQYQHFWLEALDFVVKPTSRAAVENMTFNVLKRFPDGMSRLYNLVQQNFSEANRGRANAVIIHQGCRSLIASQKTMTQYQLRGPGNQEYADLRADAPSLQEYLPGTDCQIFVAAPITATGQGVRTDVLRRTFQVGGWAACANAGWNRPAEHYRSSWSNVSIFNMINDNFEEITLKTAIARSGRFDDAGNLVTLHKTIAQQAMTYATQLRVPIVNNRVDMFVYSTTPGLGGSWNDVTHYGQMESWALSMEVVKNHAITVRSYLYRNIDGDVLKAFLVGEKLMKKLYDLPISADDIDFAKVASSPDPVRGERSIGHFAGGPVLPTKANMVGKVQNIGGLATYEPRFFGSPAGMFTLALEDRSNSEFSYISPAVWAAADGFYNGVVALYNAFLKLYGADHPLLDPAYSPSTFAPSATIGKLGETYRGYLTFAHNILAHNAPVVQIAVTRRVAGTFSAITLPVYTKLNDNNNAIRANLTPEVAVVFGNDTSIKTFADKFNAAPIAEAYRTYVLSKTTARGAQLPVQPLTNAFERFYKDEIEARFDGANNKFSSWVVDRIMQFVIKQTDRRADVVFTKENLDGLANKEMFAQYESSAASLVDTTSVGTFFNTRLVASPTRMFELAASNKAGKDDIRLASTLNPGLGAATNANFVAAQAGVTEDLSAYVVASQSHFGATRAPEPRAPFQLSAGSAPFTAFGDVGTYVVTDSATQLSTIKTNKNLIDRVKAVEKETDPWIRISALMLLWAPVQRLGLDNMYDENIITPVAVWMARAARTYDGVAAAFISRSGDMGMCAFAHPHVGRAVDNIRKLIIDNYSMYLGVAILDPGRFLVVPEVATVEYHSGETAEPILSSRPEDGGASADGDMYYEMVPADSIYGPNATAKPTMDITGKFPYATQYTATDRQSSKFDAASMAPHHSSVIFAGVRHGFNNKPARVLTRDWKYEDLADKRNTIVSRELAIVNLVDGVRHGITPADLFGYDVYPGCKASRTSASFPEITKSSYHQATEWLPF